MTTWIRVEWDHMCGGCGQQIRPGHLMQVITVIGVTRQMRRCVVCADGAPPRDMPGFVPPAPRTKSTESAKRGAVPRGLPLDFKAKASGE